MKFDDCKNLNDFEDFYPLRKNLDANAEITRIAPSPTGMPHIGTGMQAILDRALADKNNGIFILRIEDTDQARSVPGAVDAIIEGLNWLKTIPQEGPTTGGEYGPYTQSERLPLYKIACDHLVEKGEAYRCFCSSERLDEVRNLQIKNKKTPMYDQKCRHLTDEEIWKNLDAGQTFVVRMKVPAHEDIVIVDEIRGSITFKSETIDDSVIMKTDGFPTYHLASIVDDHFMRVTTVVRGEEWVPSTPKHILLYRAFGWKAPRFLHTVLLRDAQKRKLSKRSGDTSLNWFRRQGFLSEGFTNFLTRIMWTHPDGSDVYPHADFVNLMQTKNLPSTGPVVDIKLLQFINSHYIHKMTDKERTEAFVAYLEYLIAHKQTVSNTVDPAVEAEECDAETIRKMHDEIVADLDYTYQIMSVKPGRFDRLGDMIFNNTYFYDSTFEYPALEKLQKHADLGRVRGILEKFSAMYEQRPTEIDLIMKEIAKELELQDKQVFMVLRLVLTGFERTPPLPEILPVLGAKRMHRRFSGMIETINKEFHA